MNEQKQYWECCQLVLFPYQFSDIGLTLNNTTFTNNSIVTITDIGTGSTALLCTTTYSPCCYSVNPETQWYFPNGSEVLNSDQSGIPIGDLPFYRTRNTPAFVLGFPDPIPSVRLNRHPEGTTTGIFHCDVPDASEVTQSFYVGIYTSTTGEFHTVFLVSSILTVIRRRLMDRTVMVGLVNLIMSSLPLTPTFQF